MSDLAQEFEDDYPEDRDLIREVEERGATRERERIIALLEAEHKCEPYFCGIHQVIALIKGENK